MTQAWRWDQQLAITAGAYAEYDDGSGGRSLQEDEEDLSLIICEIPTEGCKNGMYNVKKCACEVGCGLQLQLFGVDGVPAAGYP